MKVLFINHAGVLGGAAVSMLDVLQTMEKLGMEVEVVSAGSPADAANMLRQRGYSVKTVPGVMSAGGYNGGVTLTQPLSWAANKLYVFRAKKCLERYIAQSDSDVVMVNSMTLYYVGRLAKRYGKKAVCFQRETITEGPAGNRIRRQMAKYFDAIVCISEYDRGHFVPYGVKTFVIYDKIDMQQYSGLQSAPNAGKILFLGGFNRLKGTMTALRACAMHKTLQLYIAGRHNGRIIGLRDCRGIAAKLRLLLYGSYENVCRRYIEKQGMGSRVTVLAPRQDVQALYEECDVVLFCPTKPHQSRLIYESAAAGRPIVVTGYPQLQEFAYGHVLTCRPGDIRSCADKLVQALQSCPDYETIRKDIQKKHDQNTLAQELETLLREVAKL